MVLHELFQTFQEQIVSVLYKLAQNTDKEKLSLFLIWS